MEVGDGADVGDIGAAAVEAVVDGKEVLGGELVNPLNLEGLVGAGFNEGSESGGIGIGGFGVGPEAGGWEVAVDFGVGLAHGDAELVVTGSEADGQG